MPISASSAFATAPAATWTAVWRALARSSALRTSSWPNLSVPARSACPGAGSVTGVVPFPVGSPSGGHGLIPHAQFSWSRLRIDERERRPERHAVTQAGEHLDLVLLELLPRAAPVALSAPPEVVVDRVAVESQPGRKPGQDRDERRARGTRPR